MRILPGVLKELLKHVPTVLFEVVEWSVLASELPKLSRRLIKKEGFTELFEKQSEFLRPVDIKLVTELAGHIENDPPRSAAEKILALYFAQIFSPHGLFLDLGPSHLDLNQDILHFRPSALWTQFHPEFSCGLKKIYDGFYLNDDPLFHQGLIESGLSSPQWPSSEQNRLAELFKSHFGGSLTQEMTFDLESFKESFFKVADFLLEKKVNISVDFLYLGIALVTLYSSLEKTRSQVNVQKIYLEVKKKLQVES